MSRCPLCRSEAVRHRQRDFARRAPTVIRWLEHGMLLAGVVWFGCAVRYGVVTDAVPRPPATFETRMVYATFAVALAIWMARWFVAIRAQRFAALLRRAEPPAPPTRPRQRAHEQGGAVYRGASVDTTADEVTDHCPRHRETLAKGRE